MITIKHLHQHRKLCDLMIAEPVKCLDDHEMLPWETDDGEPVFWCVMCDQVTHIGLNLAERIQSDIDNSPI